VDFTIIVTSCYVLMSAYLTRDGIVTLCVKVAFRSHYERWNESGSRGYV